MTGLTKEGYGDLLEKSAELVKKNKDITSLNKLAHLLGMNYNTLKAGFLRNYNISTIEQLMEVYAKTEQLIEGRNGEKIEVEFNGNFGEVRVQQPQGQIRSIDQLLKAAHVDRTVWEPFEPTVRKWDVAIKLKNGDAEEVQIIPSFYVATKLKRIHPVAFEPVVQPVTLPAGTARYKVVKSKQGAIRRALIVNDPQVGFRRRLHTSELTPFHDRRVLDLALQIAETEQIDHISFGGDCLDLSEWSDKYQPEPEFFWTTQPALVELSWWFWQFRQAQPKAEMKKLEGNHDERMPRLIVAGMKQAYRLKPVDELTLPPSLSVPRLLALHELGMEYVDGYPDNGYWLNKNVFITHGDIVRGAPGGTANAFTQRQAFTTIFGHVHRREQVARRLSTSNGDLVYSAFCPGCACHIDGRVPGSTSKSQWQQGLAVVEYTETAENIIPIAIQDGRMMYNGKLWEARTRDNEINSMLMKALDKVSE